MQTLKIKTSRAQAVFVATLDSKPFEQATSTVSEFTAARHLAVRLFVGHNCMAQIEEEVLSRISVTRLGGGSTFLATLDDPKKKGTKGGAQ